MADRKLAQNNGSDSDSPTKLTNLDQLTGTTRDIVLKSPSNKIWAIAIRALTQGQLEDIRKSIAWPRRTIKDYYRDPTSRQVSPVYDEDTYVEAMSYANNEFACRLVVESLEDIDIPGED